MRGSIIKRKSTDGKRVKYAIKFELPDGRQKWETIGPNKKEAERVLAERIQEVHGGTYREIKEIRFADFADEWLDHVKARLKPSTHAGYERYIEGHLKPAFGGYPVQALTTAAIQRWADEKLKTGLAPKSVNNFAVCLRKMLSDAVRLGYAATNPAAEVERARVPHQEMQALSPEQLRRFLEACEPGYWLLFVTAAFTGVRRGELLAIRWGDIDWQRRQLRIQRSLWRGQFVSPKSRKSIRMIDLAPQLAEALREARPSGRAEDVDEQLVFAGPDGQPLDPDNMVRRQFKPALKRAGVPSIRFHDLRHTFATLMIGAGLHPKQIQQALGHASIQTTLDIYGHLLPQMFEHSGPRIERTALEGKQLPRP